jgi:hypothetical protein
MSINAAVSHICAASEIICQEVGTGQVKNIFILMTTIHTKLRLPSASILVSVKMNL